MSKKGNAMKRYSISLTKKNIEQIALLQAELGLASISETMRAGINGLYSSTFPKYVRGGTPQPREEKSEEQIQEDKERRKEQNNERRRAMTEQKKSNELEHCMKICEQDLNGLVATDEDGNPTKCAYFQHEGRNRYTQEIDILSVSSDLKNSQYLPNEDHVRKLQEGGHIDYDINETIEDAMGAE